MRVLWPAFSGRRTVNNHADGSAAGPRRVFHDALISPKLGPAELVRRLDDPTFSRVLGEGSYARVKTMNRGPLSRLCFREVLRSPYDDDARPALNPATKPAADVREWALPKWRTPEVVLPFAQLGPYSVLRRVGGVSPFDDKDLAQSMYVLTLLRRSLGRVAQRGLGEVRLAAENDDETKARSALGGSFPCDWPRFRTAVQAQERFEPRYRDYLATVAKMPVPAFERMGRSLALAQKHGLHADFLHSGNLRILVPKGEFRLFDIEPVPADKPVEVVARATAHSPEGFRLALLGDGARKAPEHRYAEFVWSPVLKDQCKGLIAAVDEKLKATDGAYWQTLGRVRPKESSWE